jgi:ATP/ADP translocase
MNTISKEFGLIRRWTFPIYQHEIKKLLQKGTKLAFIIVNCTIIHDIKKLLEESHSDTALLHYVELFATVACLILFFTLAKIKSSKFHHKHFFIMAAPLLIIVFLFGFALYANRKLFYLPQTNIHELIHHFPGFKAFFVFFGRRGLGLVYLLSELWAGASLSKYISHFAEEIIAIHEVRRLYWVMGIIKAFEIIFAELFGSHTLKVLEKLSEGMDPFASTLHYFFSAFVLAGILLLPCFHLIKGRRLALPCQRNEQKIDFLPDEMNERPHTEQFCDKIKAMYLDFTVHIPAKVRDTYERFLGTTRSINFAYT